MAVALLTAATVFGLSYFLYPVNAVHVEGARMFPKSEVTGAVPERASLLTLNTRSLERTAESDPWVKRAEVTKDWGSGIVAVEVEERLPVSDAEVEGRRVVMAGDGTELPGTGGADLPRVTLGGEQLEDVLRTAEVLREGGATLESVDAAGPGGVEATVEGRRVVFSDGVQAGQARALAAIMRRHPEAPVFDLRSPDRVVVGVAAGGVVGDAPAGGARG